jgi:hypothetical protein
VPEIPTTQRTLVVNYLLSQTHTACGTVIDRPDARLTLYHRLPENAEAARQHMPITFGTNDTGRVRAALLGDLVPDSRQLLPIILAWSTAPRLDGSVYSIGLHLDDEDGTLARQTDLPLAAGPYRCQYAEIPLSGLSSGTYSLYAIVYNWQTGDRLSVPDSPVGDDRALIGTLTLVTRP